MAIHVNCPHCNERLNAMRTTCSHCDAALPPGILFALSVALGEEPLPTAAMPMQTTPSHLTAPPEPFAPPPPEPSPGAFMASNGTSPDMAPVTQQGAMRPWLAAILSLLCGLGQLYNGQVGKGMILIILATAAVASLPLLVSKIALPILLVYAVIDAFIVARRGGRGPA